MDAAHDVLGPSVGRMGKTPVGVMIEHASIAPDRTARGQGVTRTMAR